jgi:hypothetical protein
VVARRPVHAERRIEHTVQHHVHGLQRTARRAGRRFEGAGQDGGVGVEPRAADCLRLLYHGNQSLVVDQKQIIACGDALRDRMQRPIQAAVPQAFEDGGNAIRSLRVAAGIMGCVMRVVV